MDVPVCEMREVSKLRTEDSCHIDEAMSPNPPGTAYVKDKHSISFSNSCQAANTYLVQDFDGVLARW